MAAGWPSWGAMERGGQPAGPRGGQWDVADIWGPCKVENPGAPGKLPEPQKAELRWRGQGLAFHCGRR